MKTNTKQKIVSAARELFVKNGYAGTSMGKIGKKAGVTHSLLFHHFGNKARLWTEVKQLIVDEANQQKQTLPPISWPFDEFLKELATGLLHFYKDNPDILRMIGWQRLEGEDKKEAGPQSLTEEAKKWQEAFACYQSKGAIRKDISVDFALSFFLSIFSHIGIDKAPFIKSESELNDYIDFCLKGILQVLSP